MVSEGDSHRPYYRYNRLVYDLVQSGAITSSGGSGPNLYDRVDLDPDLGLAVFDETYGNVERHVESLVDQEPNFKSLIGKNYGEVVSYFVDTETVPPHFIPLIARAKQPRIRYTRSLNMAFLSYKDGDNRGHLIIGKNHVMSSAISMQNMLRYSAGINVDLGTATEIALKTDLGHEIGHIIDYVLCLMNGHRQLSFKLGREEIGRRRDRLATVCEEISPSNVLNILVKGSGFADTERMQHLAGERVATGFENIILRHVLQMKGVDEDSILEVESYRRYIRDCVALENTTLMYFLLERKLNLADIEQGMRNIIDYWEAVNGRRHPLYELIDDYNGIEKFGYNFPLSPEQLQRYLGILLEPFETFEASSRGGGN